MCQKIDSEMVIDYALAKHDSISYEQLKSIRNQIFLEIPTPIIIDITLRGLQKIQTINPNKIKINIKTDSFLLERLEKPCDEDFLDKCYSPFFTRDHYLKIKKIFFQAYE